MQMSLKENDYLKLLIKIEDIAVRVLGWRALYYNAHHNLKTLYKKSLVWEIGWQFSILTNRQCK